MRNLIFSLTVFAFCGFSFVGKSMNNDEEDTIPKTPTFTKIIGFNVPAGITVATQPSTPAQEKPLVTTQKARTIQEYYLYAKKDLNIKFSFGKMF
ncbi:hypothetical protein Bealeia1_00010 [Candidatus Bealeia paramacronuclearis]|uniref:Uncharacterized protein n=1 Tax=Candidatus Bealeia paramacronuclearis TaxID=1921001 RepID=A0ABZ2C060_9PROT|nr:hypothetical protein [Candidatus Bealeia paramacronuclearis]